MTDPTIYLVDDDKGVRKALTLSLSKRGYNIESFDSAESYLGQYEKTQRGCLILDIRMPGMSGIELQKELQSYELNLPIIFITGHGDVPLSVTAMKAGAVDFLEKPFRHNILIERIEEAFAINDSESTQDNLDQLHKSRFALLTDREQEIMALLIAGPADQSSKQIARTLNISPRTVEHHRARVMEKMEAKSLTHLAAMMENFGELTD
jgi:two-component system response regulator FixJ